jgi:hypothetical protein
MIKSLILNKQRNIDAATMDQILNGNMIEIVRVNIIFDWHTILSRKGDEHKAVFYFYATHFQC